MNKQFTLIPIKDFYCFAGSEFKDMKYGYIANITVETHHLRFYYDARRKRNNLRDAHSF